MDEKNCKECLHFEACCKWTDFPKQIGVPVCRKYRRQSDKTIELSCKVGDLVYEVCGWQIFEYVITSIEISSPYEIVYKVQSTQPWNRFVRFIGFTKQNIGKTIFLTREEAEKAKKKGGAE